MTRGRPIAIHWTKETVMPVYSWSRSKAITLAVLPAGVPMPPIMEAKGIPIMKGRANFRLVSGSSMALIRTSMKDMGSAAEGILDIHMAMKPVPIMTPRSSCLLYTSVLGLDLLEKAAALREKESAAASEGDPEIDALVARRTEAKKAKNWAEADAIRDQLKAMGIEVTDTPQGPVWKRI